MQLTSALLILATTALSGVSAHPSGHSPHSHAHLHAKKDAAEPVLSNSPVEARDEDIVSRTGEPLLFGGPIEARGGKKWSKYKRPTIPKITPPSDAAVKPSPVGGLPHPPSIGAFKPFCGGLKSRATLDDIAYVGNSGVGKWGCNIMEIDCGATGMYDYTARFDSTDNDYSCSAFNKIGPEGKIDGFWFSALDFTIGAGGAKCLAFDKNSQGGVACGAGRGGVPRTGIGQLAGTWLEFDAGSNRNADNSGSDVSVLVAGANNMPYVGMSVKDPLGRQCSWVKSNGQNQDAYMPGMEALDGVGCKGYYKGMLHVKLGDAF